MKTLDNGLNNVPEAEPRSSLSSNSDVTRGSALGFPGQEPAIEILLEQLAALIVDVYFHENNLSE